MLTPQEIQDKKFEKAMFGGYDMGQIDEFLDLVLEDYTALYKENATLKAKMRVLVDKIEEYRAVDEEMRKTLYTAQVTAKDITDKAQREADAMLAGARAEAQKNIGDIQDEIEAEQRRLQEAKQAAAMYAQKIRGMLMQNVEVLDSIMEQSVDSLHVPAAAPASTPAEGPVPEQLPQEEFGMQDDINHAAELIEQSIESQLEAMDAAEREPVAAKAAPQTKPEEKPAADDMQTRFFEIELGEGRKSVGKRTAEPESDTARIYGDSVFTPKPRFDFSDLRFGKNFQEDNED